MHKSAPTPNRWLPAETLVFLAVWLLLMVAGRQRLFQDPGTFWHTAVGERMLASGELVRQDPFTFTFVGRPWLAHQWLGECLMAAGYRLGGWDTLLLATASLLAAFYAWLAHRWQKLGCQPLTTAVMLGLVFIASAHHYHVRPHLASMVLLGVSFAILCDVDSGRARIGRLLWLVPLFALWTNCHGGALGGLATLTFVVAGWMMAWILGLRCPLTRGRDAVWAAAVLLACWSTMLLNPFGVEMPRAWLAIMRLSLADVIQEHGRLDFRRPEAWMVVVLGLGYLALLWRTPDWRVTWLIPLVWLLLACDRVRHVPLFAIVAAIAAAEFLRQPLQPLEKREPRAFVIPLLLVIGCLTLQAVGLALPVVGRGWVQLDRRIWPSELLPQLRELERLEQPRPIFNALHLGGFLEFHTPGLATFIDDRCELFGDAFLHQYAEAEQRQPERIDVWQHQHGFQHALVRANSPWDAYLAKHARWRALARCEAAVLYQHVRQGSPLGPPVAGHPLGTSLAPFTWEK